MNIESPSPIMTEVGKSSRPKTSRTTMDLSGRSRNVKSSGTKLNLRSLMDNQNLPDIAQANEITESRYDFNRLEKNALYCIIRQVRKDYIETPTEQREYSNMRIDIPEYMLAEIADKAHRKDAKDALISLRHRDITITYPDGGWLNVGFVNYARFDPKRKVFEVEVSSQIIPYLVNLASRYTVLSLTIAISLKSKWSQRLYELCCQYRNHLEKGIPTFHKTIGQLRTMFSLEDKYPKLPDFKSRIIDTAQKELKESYENNQCDLWFEYTQVGRGEQANFNFVIHTREATQSQEKEFKEKRQMAYEIYKTLLSIFPKDTKYCDKCWKHLDFFPDKIEPLYGKLQRIMKDYTGVDRAKVARFMLEEDFDMTNKKLPK